MAQENEPVRILAIAMASGFKMVKPRGIWYAVFSLSALTFIGVYVEEIIVSKS